MLKIDNDDQGEWEINVEEEKSTEKPEEENHKNEEEIDDKDEEDQEEQIRGSRKTNKKLTRNTITQAGGGTRRIGMKMESQNMTDDTASWRPRLLLKIWKII